jgi:hypothetical protein
MLILLTCRAAATMLAGKIDVAATWVAQNYSWVADRIMPLPEYDPMRYEWTFSVRVTPPWDPEFVVSLRKARAGQLSLSYIIADGDDLGKQAEAIIKANPGISRKNVLPKLRVKRSEIGDRCKDLVDLAASVERLSLSALPPGGLVLDGVGYDYRANFDQGEMRGNGLRPDSDVARWAQRAREIADRCSAQ